MVMHLVVSHRTGKFLLYNNSQLQKGRARYVVSSDSWTMVQQLRMADQFGFCAQVRGERVCGGNIPDGRGKCKTCPDLGGVVNDPDFLVRSKDLRVCMPVVPKEELNSVETGTQTNQEIVFETQTHKYTIRVELKRNEISREPIRTIYDTLPELFSKASLGNAKTHFKQTCQLLGLDDHTKVMQGAYVEKMLELGPQGFFEKTQEFKQTRKLRDNAARLMVEFKEQKFRDEVHELRVPGLRESARIIHTPCTAPRLELIRQTLCRYEASSVQHLLERLRKVTLEFQPESIEEMRWKWRELMAWWFPGVRDGSSGFRFRTPHLPGITNMYKSTLENQVVVNTDSELVGLHFGLLKGFVANKQQRYRKTFQLTEDGLSTYNRKGLFIHLTESEYATWWNQVSKLLQMIIADNRVRDGDWLFKLSKSERKSQRNLFDKFATFHGRPLKAQVGRTIFRNAYSEKESDDFYQFIMQHSQQTDVKDYWKPDLSDLVVTATK